MRFALFAPRHVSAPVRPAMVGACIGVVGLVGVAVAGASLDRFVDTPARWGTPWDAAIEVRKLGRKFDPNQLLDDRDVDAAAVGLFDEQVTIEGEETNGSTTNQLKGNLIPTVVSGREPRAADEVAVGPDTLDALGVSLGDEVDISSRSAAHKQFRVVGEVLFPTLNFSFPLAEGASFTLEGGDRLVLGDPERDDAGTQWLLLRWADGVDGDAALQRLDYDETAVDPPRAPAEVGGLRDVRQFPAAAAAGLILLGVISTSHALAVTVRRRRTELGVLSALGFTGRQRRLVIAVQATAVACIALLIGTPLGAVAGRLVWSAIASSMGVATDASFPATLLIGGAVAVVVVLNLMAALPARAAARLKVAEALRSE